MIKSKASKKRKDAMPPRKHELGKPIFNSERSASVFKKVVAVMDPTTSNPRLRAVRSPLMDWDLIGIIGWVEIQEAQWQARQSLRMRYIDKIIHREEIETREEHIFGQEKKLV
ncbi:hypothetical protein QQP08_008407 [Theobroma cacao]|nr:hypothetical protein QQP08_008407 [Theobroma cacao]